MKYTRDELVRMAQFVLDARLTEPRKAAAVVIEVARRTGRARRWVLNRIELIAMGVL